MLLFLTRLKALRKRVLLKGYFQKAFRPGKNINSHFFQIRVSMHSGFHKLLKNSLETCLCVILRKCAIFNSFSFSMLRSIFNYNLYILALDNEINNILGTPINETAMKVTFTNASGRFDMYHVTCSIDDTDWDGNIGITKPDPVSVNCYNNDDCICAGLLPGQRFIVTVVTKRQGFDDVTSSNRGEIKAGI